MKSISYFSYKGGSGRTSLLFNTLPFLAQELNASAEHPIIVLDLDLDSKGLSYLLKGPNNSTSSINVVQVLKQQPKIYDFRLSKENFFGMMLPVGELVGLEENEAILFITAHALPGAETLGSSNNFDASNVDLDPFIEKCSNFDCSAVIFDNAAGGQLSADAALSVSDKTVVVMRITSQFRDGTLEFLNNLPNRFGRKEFIIAPNAVPLSCTCGFDTSKIMSNFKKEVLDLKITNNKINLFLLNPEENGINEVERFKFTETNLYARSKLVSLSNDEQLAMDKYQRLAKEIAHDEH